MVKNIKYKFSLPMPYEKQNIDKLIDLNKQIEKSQITSLYFGLPSTCESSSGFEQSRNLDFEKINFDYWKNLMNYSLEKGFDFVYLLNNLSPLDSQNIGFYDKIEKLDKLLKELEKIGIKKLRIASSQLSSYIFKHYSHFDIYASTSLDYKTISEYQNFIMFHPEIKQIVPSHDINKNFKLLKNLKKDYPNLEIELMVNEGCMQGCPNRMIHEMRASEDNIRYNDIYFSPSRYCITFCNYIANKYPFHSLTLNNNIYPWEIEEYAKIGINKFKLVGRDAYIFRFEQYLNEYLLYFKAIDEYKSAEEVSITTFIHHLNKNYILDRLKTNEIKHLLPKIEHFKKYGHLCSSRCGVECQYCYKCAEKIKKVYEKKMKEREKEPHYVPACKIT